MDADLPQVIRWVFGDLQAMPDDPGWMASRAVLAAKNVDVDAINALATATFPGEATQLISADAMVGDAEDELQIPIEYLNTLTAPGFPPHLLQLKTGMPVMLLRNLSPAEGLCNGSRLIIRRVISGRLLQATIATGPLQGRQVFLPRVALHPPEDAFPFSWERRQFPVKPAFGMTIHKAQGQTLGRVAVLLTEPAFTHGQMYIRGGVAGGSCRPAAFRAAGWTWWPHGQRGLRRRPALRPTTIAEGQPTHRTEPKFFCPQGSVSFAPPAGSLRFKRDPSAILCGRLLAADCG